MVPLGPNTVSDGTPKAESAPILMPPTPIETEKAPASLELNPAFPDNRSFTNDRKPPAGSAQDARTWESLPKNGLVLVGDPMARPTTTGSLGGLPDRLGSNGENPIGTSSHSSASAVTSPAIMEWQLESLRLASEQKRRLGVQVSTDILQDDASPKEVLPTAIEPPAGWQSIEIELKKHLTDCDDLLRRGAVFSGRQEALIAIRLLLRNLDQRRSRWVSEPSFDQALVAFRESTEFYESMQHPERSQDVPALVRGHQTPVLKNTELKSLPPAIAAQHYMHFAKDRMIAAAEYHPWASDLYYALGKCFERQAEESTLEQSMLLSQAAACYQAALATKNNHAQAANQLGFVLLQLDRNQEAEFYLRESLKMSQTPQAYRNLAELYRRNGNEPARTWATNQIAALQVSAPNRMGVPAIQEVDPATFASISPRNAWTYSANTPNPTSAPAANGQVQQASATSWLGRLFR